MIMAVAPTAVPAELSRRVYASTRDALLDAARRYVTEVASQHYPDEAHSYA